MAERTSSRKDTTADDVPKFGLNPNWHWVTILLFMVLTLSIGRGLLNQYVAGLAACLSMVASGSAFTWITPILGHLLSPESEIPMTASQASWIVSILPVGFALSPVPIGMLCNYIGRKFALLLSSPLYIISWLMVIYFPTVLVLVAARVIQGVALGIVYTVTPIYLGEIASKSARGAITSMVFNSWWFGILLSYVAGQCLTYKAFTYFVLAINLPFLLLFIVQSESPHFYLLNEKDEHALDSLKKFRDLPPDLLQEEFMEIKRDVEGKKAQKITDVVATKVDRKSLALLIMLTAVRALSGSGCITVYATQMFELTPNLSISSHSVTITLGVVMLLGGCISSFTSDVFGRRPLLLISCVISLICQFGAGTYYFLLFNTSLDVAGFSWIAPALILVYSGMCTAGMYPVSSAYSSELFTSNTRGIASACSTLTTTAVCFFLLVTYHPITDTFGLYAEFYFYTLTLFLGTLYFYCFAPETKGKSFAQIRRELSEK